MPLEFVKRKEWTKHAEENPDKIHHPAHCVWYSVTCTHTCNDGETCKQRAKAIMREHRLDFKRKDISYNFLIGDDGKIIEARGWDLTPDLPAQYLALKFHSIYIAFIGWYNYNEMPKKLYNIAEELVKYGIEKNYITPKFVLNDMLTPYARKVRLEDGQFWPGYGCKDIS